MLSHRTSICEVLSRATLRLCFLAFLAIGIAAIPLWSMVSTSLGSIVHPDMRVNFEAHATTVYVHIFASSIALLCGVLQFSTSLRVVGRYCIVTLAAFTSLLGVIPGGIAGLIMAINAYGGIVSKLGFGFSPYFGSTRDGKLTRRYDAGQIQQHQQWMIRNYALTCAAITLRIYLPLSMVAGIPFELVPAIAWLCWVPNLAYAQFKAGKLRRSSKGIATPKF